MSKIKSNRPNPDEVLELPEKFESLIRQAIESEGLRLTQSERLASAVKKQSDFYIHQTELPTPWVSDWARVAQWAYYLPLNYLRARRVVLKGQELSFFDGLDSFVELGPGLGAASLALTLPLGSSDKKLPQFNSGLGIEIDLEAVTGFKKTQASFRELDFVDISNREDKINGDLSRTVAVFSYVLNELDRLPQWATQCEAIMIMEPATHQEGRKLLELRQNLIDLGFSIWAPCTHQGLCPLLSHSKKDWCHDRVHWKMPEWLESIDRELPIKNNTLTMSYLLARKTPPMKTVSVSQQNSTTRNVSGTARLVGDILHEKGKSRTLICRGEEREFLSWLHKDIKKNPDLAEKLDLARGDLIDLPDFVQKGNELRAKL